MQVVSVSVRERMLVLMDGLGCEPVQLSALAAQAGEEGAPL